MHRLQQNVRKSESIEISHCYEVWTHRRRRTVAPNHAFTTEIISFIIDANIFSPMALWNYLAAPEADAFRCRKHTKLRSVSVPISHRSIVPFASSASTTHSSIFCISTAPTAAIAVSVAIVASTAHSRGGQCNDEQWQSCGRRGSPIGNDRQQYGHIETGSHLHLLREIVFAEVRIENSHSHAHRIQAAQVQILLPAIRRSQQFEQTHSLACAREITIQMQYLHENSGSQTWSVAAHEHQAQ